MHSFDLDFKMVYQYANDSMIIHHGITGEILEVNNRSCELYGYSREQILSMEVGELSPKNALYNQEKAMTWLKEALVTNKLLTFDWVIRRANGDVIPVESNLKRIEGTSPPLILGMARDISQRKTLEKKLREQGLYYKRLIGMSSDGIALIDKSGIIKYVSPSIMNILGIPASCCEKENVFNYIADSDARKIASDLTKAKHGKLLEGFVSYKIRNANGEWRNHEASFKNYLQDPRFGYILINYRDVTDRIEKENEEKKRARQLNHFWRLTIAGEISAALAHEVNQPLCAARNFFAGCRRRIDSGDFILSEIGDRLKLAEKELDRAARIITSIRNFTRNSPMNVVQKSLVEVISAISDFIEITCKNNECQLIVDIKEDGLVSCDEILIQQVITNIVVNAMEAMQSKEPEMRILILRTRLDEGFIFLHAIDSGGNFPFTSIDELPGRFFTTKDTGVGLGLSLCRSIIDAHRGRFYVKNICDPEGTCFYFGLPCINSDLQEEPQLADIKDT